MDLSELTVAKVEAKMFPKLMVSCGSGSRLTEVVEVTMLMEVTVAEVEAEMLRSRLTQIVTRHHDTVMECQRSKTDGVARPREIPSAWRRR